MRYTALFILSYFLLESFNSSAQQVHNIYGNLNWIADDVSNLQSQMYIGPSLRGLRRYQPEFRAQSPSDTNAYSIIRYDLGGNANQRLQAELDRPLSKATRFYFDLDRQSYPGWMTSSFSRSTDLSAGLDYVKRKGLSVRGRVGILSTDREMNGGLKGDTYGFENDGFSSLANDVWYTGAFVRNQDLYGKVDVSYSLSQNDTSSFRIGIAPGAVRERFEYENPNADSTYFESFGETLNLQAINDSSQLVRFENEAYLQYAWKPDSIRTIDLKAWYGIDVFTYRSNDLSSDFVNNRIGGRLVMDALRIHSSITLESIFQGFNAGDLSLKSDLRFSLLTPDSIHARRGDLLLKFDGRVNRAPLLFERYRSAVTQRALDLNRVARLDASVSYHQSNDKSGFELGAAYTYLLGWTYFDDALRVRQYNAPLFLLSPFIRLKHEGKVLQLDAAVRYQYHERSKIYSMPDWVAESYLGFRFPLFKKRIYMTGGVEGWYFSGYVARGYLPLYDMFYVQQQRRFEDFMQFNPRLSARIQTVDVSIRYMNANYGFTSDSPLIAPGFPSVPRFLMASVAWRFKN